MTAFFTCSSPYRLGAMDSTSFLWISGSLAISLKSFSSSGVMMRLSGSLLAVSMLTASRYIFDVLLGVFASRSGMVLKIPVTITLSPGLARSTISPLSSTSITLGIWPGGRSSGFSCMPTSWKSMYSLSSGIISNFLPLHLSHLSGVLSLGVDESSDEKYFAPQVEQAKTAVLSMGRTVLALTIIPSTAISLPR